jgi:hypothetical protein
MGTKYLVNEDDTHVEAVDEIEEFPAGTNQAKKNSFDLRALCAVL